MIADPDQLRVRRVWALTVMFCVAAAPYHSWALPCLFVALAAVVAALFILGYGVGSSIEQRRFRRAGPRIGQVLRGTDDADGGADVVVW